jgi:hypothetical protein
MLPAVSIRIHSGDAVPDKQARAVSSIERCNPEQLDAGFCRTQGGTAQDRDAASQSTRIPVRWR